MTNSNIITLLNLKKYRKSYLSLFVVIVLACTFTIAIAIFHDSLKKTEERQREMIYGSWHMAVYNTEDTLYQDLLRHGTIQKLGKMNVYGNILGDNGSIAGVIGSANKDMVSMGITLVDGHLPVNDNEIAVEMSYLSMLNISYELGQQIPLTIQVLDSGGKPLVIEKTFQLTGVLENYSSLWKSAGNPLVSFFITDSALQGKPVFEHVFGVLKKQYINNVDELAMLTENVGSFNKNDYTYNYYEHTGNKNLWYETLLSGSVFILLVALTSAFFIFNIFYTSLKNHNKSFIIMRSLGASKQEIAVMYCKELTIVLTLSFFAGIIVGFLVSCIAYQVIRYFIADGFVFYFDTTKIVLLLLILIFCVFLFAVFSVFHIGKMPLTGNIMLQPDNRISFKHMRKFKPLTVRNMVRIFNSAHKREAVVYFLLTVGTFLVLASTFYHSYKNYTNYTNIINTYTEDYFYGIMNSYFEPKVHLEESEVDKIKDTYGIDYVRAYRCSNYLPISWNGMEESEYALLLKNWLFAKYASKAGVFASVYGLSGQKQDYEFYMDEVDRGQVAVEEFLKGNEVILYLPLYYKTEDGGMRSNTNRANSYLKESYDLIQEDTVNPGDEIVISGANGEVTVKVAGIIYDFKNRSTQSFLGKPFSVICYDSLYDKLIPSNQNKTYELLQIYADKNANYERTDVEISNIKDNFYLQNYRQLKEQNKYDALISVAISLTLSILSLLITVTIQYNTQISKIDSDYWRNYTLSVLGMDKWKIQFIYLYNILKNNILAAVVGFILIYSYQTIKFISYIIPEDGRLIKADSYIFRQYFSSLPWLYIGIFTIAYLLMNVSIAFFPLKKYRKIKE